MSDSSLPQTSLWPRLAMQREQSPVAPHRKGGECGAEGDEPAHGGRDDLTLSLCCEAGNSRSPGC